VGEMQEKNNIKNETNNKTTTIEGKRADPVLFLKKMKKDVKEKNTEGIRTKKCLKLKIKL
jgi:hypothetical protein